MLYTTEKGEHMSKTRIREIEKQIAKIKKELQAIGPMRPGSLTRQFRVPQKKLGPFYQLSYMHKMKSRTEYVRPQFLRPISSQIATYKRFKKLVEKWIELSIAHSKLTLDFEKKKDSK
jgi:hypothetical protein